MTTIKDDNRIRDRRAQLVISRQQIIQMLRLPEGTHLSYIEAGNDPLCFRVGVTHEALPVVPPDEEAPVIPTEKVGRERRMIDGEVWERSVVWFDISKAAERADRRGQQ